MHTLRHTNESLSFRQFLNNDDRQRRTVFHEAGHDKIVRRRGGTIVSVEIDSRSGQESRIVVEGLGGVENGTDVAVAGLLAEARGVAFSMTTAFNRHLNVDRMNDVATSIVQRLENPDGTGRFNIVVPMFPGGHSVEESTATVADFEYAIEHGMDDAQLLASLIRVANDLNKDNIWKSVVWTADHFRTIDQGRISMR